MAPLRPGHHLVPGAKRGVPAGLRDADGAVQGEMQCITCAYARRQNLRRDVMQHIMHDVHGHHA